MMLRLSILTSLALTFMTVIAIPANSEKAAKPANTAAKPNCISGNFNKPWLLHNILVWEPFRAPESSNATETGYISFTFCDSNKDLALVTSCTGDLINGATDGYTLCKNSSVAFQFTSGGEILMERAYIDPCLGSPPYDEGTAFGQNQTHLVKQKTPGFGRTWKQAKLPVQITALA